MQFLFNWYFSSEGGTSRTSSGGSRTGNMHGQNNDESVANTSTDKPVQHKWPIRPGVHVHVNGLHTLNNSNNTSSSSNGAGPKPADPGNKISGFTYGARNSNSGSGSSAGSTANCDDLSNAGSSTTGADDAVITTSTMNQKHKEVIARGTSTERNVPASSESNITPSLSENSQTSNNVLNENSRSSNNKAMQGR